MTFIAASAAVGYLVFLGLYASILDPVRVWLYERVLVIRALIVQDCVFCAAFWASIPVGTAAVYSGHLSWVEALGLPFMGGLFVSVGKLVDYATAAITAFLEDSE